MDYNGNFASNLVSLLHPLHHLVQVRTHWICTKKCQHSFDNAKAKLVTALFLVTLTTNCPSKWQEMHFSKRLGQSSLTSCPTAQKDPLLTYHAPSFQVKKKAQVEKEALSLLFGVKMFHQFPYTKHFSLVTDHKTLTDILGPKEDTSL